MRAKLIPATALFWQYCALVGFYLSPTFYGTLLGLAAGIGFSFVVYILVCGLDK